MTEELPVVTPPSTPVYRVAFGFDPFQPTPWRFAHEDGTFDNRFDDPRGRAGVAESERFRIIYCATQRAGAFGETTARFRASLRLFAGLQDVDSDEPLDDLTALRGVVPADWRLARRLGSAHLNPSLRFADVADGRTAQILRRVPKVAETAASLNLPDIDLSSLTSHHRTLTQEIARYVYEQMDTQGRPLFAGLRYLSRLHQAWECWAIFDTRLTADSFTSILSEPIRPDDPGLVEAASILDLSIEATHQ